MSDRTFFYGMTVATFCVFSYIGYGFAAWVPFTMENPAPPQMTLWESDNGHVSFSVEICGMNSEDPLVGDILYQRIRIPDHWFYGVTGFLNIPVVGVLIATPNCDSAISDVIPTDSFELSNHNVYPMPDFIEGEEGFLLEEVFIKNDSIYSVNSYFPGDLRN